MIKSYQHENRTFYRIHASVTLPCGRRVQRKFSKDRDGRRLASKNKAERLKAEYTHELRLKLEQVENAPSFEKWHKVFLSRIKLTHKSSTIYQYNGDLTKWLDDDFKNLSLLQISKNRIYELIFSEMKERKATPNTQLKVLKCLRKVFSSAIDEGLIAKNPTSGITVKVPEAEKLVLNSEQAHRLLESSKSCGHQFYYLWAMALLTGMRNGELYGLRWSDVDLNTGFIKISSSWDKKNGHHSTKSNRTRLFPVGPDLNDLLLELKNLGPFEGVLESRSGNNKHYDDLVLPRLKEWSYGEQARVTKEFCHSIGLPQIKFHDLRATFITNLLANGTPLVQVMSMVGHTRMSTTDVYLRLAGVDVKGATKALSYSLPTPNRENVIPVEFG